jgi:hypothetical protein
MTRKFGIAALSLVPGLLAGAVPAAAATAFDHSPMATAASGVEASWNDRRDWRDRRYDNRYYGRDRYNDGYRGQTWRGNDGRYYCRRDNGTTGLLIGGAAGGLIGNGVAGRGDRTLGTLLGVAGGALLGREIDRSGSRCR